MAVPGASLPPPPPPESSRRRAPVIVGVAVAAALLGVIGGLVLRNGQAEESTTVETLDATSTTLALAGGESFELGPSDVLMEPANVQGPESFSVEPLAVVVPAEYTAPVQPTASAPSSTEAAKSAGVAGRKPGLYGGTNDNAKCDAVAMVEFLMANQDKAAAWVKAQNTDPRIAQQFGRPMEIADIPAYIGQLTPVVLNADQRTTNFGFKNGEPKARQVVMQKGTAVLVDKEGVIRARCLCGNPQTPPIPTPETPNYVKIPPPDPQEPTPPSDVPPVSLPCIPPRDEEPECGSSWTVPNEPIAAVPPAEPLLFVNWPGFPPLEVTPPGDPNGAISPLPPVWQVSCPGIAPTDILNALTTGGCVFLPSTYGVTPPPYGGATAPPDTTLAPETTVAPETTLAPTTTAAPAPAGSPPVLELASVDVRPEDESQGCLPNRFGFVRMRYSDADGDALQDLFVNGGATPSDPAFITVAGDGSSGTIEFSTCYDVGGTLTFSVNDAAGNPSNQLDVVYQ